MMKARTRHGVSFGGPTVLTVLVVLCLACFSLISLSRAQADRALAARSAQTVAAYYAAESKAEAVLAAVHEHCALPPQEAGQAMERTAREAGAEASYDVASQTLRYAVSAGEQGQVTASLALTADEGGTRLTVQSLRLVPVQTKETEQMLPVLQ